jgi:hypothetical protein
MNMTPYAACKIVNNMLKEMGIEKTLPPQMFYNYVKKNFIKNDNGKINEKDLLEWFTKYSNKLLNKNNTPVQLSLLSE